MNKLITVDEAISGLMADIEHAAKDLGISEMAVAIAFGAMCGAPLAESDLKWAAAEIEKAMP